MSFEWVVLNLLNHVDHHGARAMGMSIMIVHVEYMCDIFGYHNWLQSDAAFFYPRLDQYSLSVGMF